jgi:hypothetical protein
LRAGERPDWDWASFLWLQALFGSVWAGLAAAGEQASGLAAPVQWSPMLIGEWPQWHHGLAFALIVGGHRGQQAAGAA